MTDPNQELSPGMQAAEAPAEPQRLPGRLLRAEREQRGLGISEVAQALKFSPRQIEALEADDYGALPAGPTFLRGFVRSYAKLLKLDAAPLLASLDACAPAALPDVRAPQNMGIAATPVTAGQRSAQPLIIGSSVLALLVLALALWHFFGTPAAPSSPRTPTAPESKEPAAEVRTPETRVEAAPPAAPAAAPEVPLAPDMRQLVFAFRDKSWVEVRDASQRVLYSAENQAGTRQVVAGRPPFQLVVGNAAAVDLQYDDRPVDLKPYIRAEVARFTLE